MHRLFLTTLLALVTPAALAQVTVHDPWVRATVPAQHATGAFMQLTAARDTRLVAVHSPLAAAVEIHEMSMTDHVMRMRAIPGLDLPAGKTVALAPGGFHLMLLELKQQVKAGGTVALTLVFENADRQRTTVEVAASARALSEVPPAKPHLK